MKKHKKNMKKTIENSSKDQKIIEKSNEISKNDSSLDCFLKEIRDSSREINRINEKLLNPVNVSMNNPKKTVVKDKKNKKSLEDIAKRLETKDFLVILYQKTIIFVNFLSLSI